MSGGTLKAIWLCLALSLGWCLCAQDAVDVFDIDPTNDLPEMLSQVDLWKPCEVFHLDRKPKPEPRILSVFQPLILRDQPHSLMATPWPATAVFTTPWVRLRWFANNPPTAPPRRSA